ncbi:hypothetical protein UVI_02027940 [Ustilaginoidea virens]|uniref:Large ribosomal subunit protein bL33m n=1 Tax=Ustilaginoidea virens TaxID=1159556 RepID=A0A1B5KVF7_USTVR|nr:hypothetical protein UVI_02027940 [Ustilaginoidea virens]
MAKKAKARLINVRLISMAMTGFFYTFKRPRTAPLMGMLKYDPIVDESAKNILAKLHVHDYNSSYSPFWSVLANLLRGNLVRPQFVGPFSPL